MSQEEKKEELINELTKLHRRISELEILETNHKKTKQKLNQMLKEWEATFNSMIDLVSVQDKGAKVVKVNKAYVDVLRIKPEEIIGKRCYELFPGAKNSRLICPHKKVLRTKKSAVTRFFEPQLGIYFEASTSPILNQKSEVIGTVCVVKDITERQKKEEQLYYMATHDGPTGLPNRSLFNDHLLLALHRAHRNHQKLAIMLIDMDRFKDVNDTLGHKVGDKLLRAIADRFKSCLRKSDIIARMGGDEFLLFLSPINQTEDAYTAAQKILTASQKPFVVDGREITITPSIGIAIYPTNGKDIDSLVKNADIAMYNAKEKGRNRYQLYSADMKLKNEL